MKVWVVVNEYGGIVNEIRMFTDRLESLDAVLAFDGDEDEDSIHEAEFEIECKEECR